MTFSEFVLKSRKRLHDLRTANGAIITDAATDGIRWSSDSLQELCIGALQEMLRTFRALKLDNYIHVEVQTRIVACKIESATGLVIDLPDDYLRVTRIQEPTRSNIYDWKDPETFFSKKWLTAGSTDDEAIEERWLTSVFDTDDKVLKTYVTPIPTSDIENCSAIVTLGLEDFYTLASTEDLPFLGINDLMLDYVEKQARQEDHDDQFRQIVTGTITTKLQELQLELQTSNR